MRGLVGAVTAAAVVTVGITWPSGAETVLTDLTVDRHYTVVEGETAPRPAS
jgi:hypothetical protein